MRSGVYPMEERVPEARQVCERGASRITSALRTLWVDHGNREEVAREYMTVNS